MQKKNHDYSSFCNTYMEICLGVLFSVAMDHEHQRQLRRLLFLSLLKLSSNLFIMISSSFTIVIKNIIISHDTLKTRGISILSSRVSELQ